MSKSYEKTRANPLYLGKGLVIETDTFTDKDFNEVNRKKLKAAVDSGLANEINVKEEAKKVANTNDATITNLENQLREAKEELAKALTTIKELQTGDVDAWMTMSVDELKAAYTIPELKVFCTELEVDFKSNSKETSLANKIVEALKDDEGSTTEDDTGSTGEGSED